MTRTLLYYILLNIDIYIVKLHLGDFFNIHLGTINFFFPVMLGGMALPGPSYLHHCPLVSGHVGLVLPMAIGLPGRRVAYALTLCM